jgi:uncharacterized protein YndB with AHSA1/START domain
MDPTSREEAVRIEVTIGAPVDVVWQALRDPDQVRRWHGWHDPGLADEIKLIYQTGAHETNRPYVLEVEPYELFELEEVEGGTRVRITRSKPDPKDEWAAYYDDVTEGWISFLHQLRFMLEQHPHEERRTVFFSAEATNATPDNLIADSPAGSGTPWFTSENQRGVVVDGLGPGLLIVGRTAKGGAMAILTTYGQDGAAFEQTSEQWTTWWRTHHPDAPAPTV